MIFQLMTDEMYLKGGKKETQFSYGGSLFYYFWRELSVRCTNLNNINETELDLHVIWVLLLLIHTQTPFTLFHSAISV